MPAWRVWYADGSTVSSEDCAPEDAPGRGVQVIAQPDSREGPGVWNVHWVTLCANFYYYRTDVAGWFPAETRDDLLEMLFDREPVVAACKGKRLPHARFQEIYAQAKTWADEQGLGPKTHFAPEERKP